MTYQDEDQRATGRMSQYRLELEQLSKEELIDRVMKAEGRLGEATVAGLQQPTATRSFEVEWQPQEYVRLPATRGRKRADQPLWRVALVSIDLTHAIIGLEVAGDVTLGRATSDSHPDFDLTPFHANNYGVSRTHAMLRPTEDGLLIADMGSTNGSEVNGEELQPGVWRALADRDRIRLGNLEFQVKILDAAD